MVEEGNRRKTMPCVLDSNNVNDLDKQYKVIDTPQLD